MLARMSSRPGGMAAGRGSQGGAAGLQMALAAAAAGRGGAGRGAAGRGAGA